MLQGPQGCAHGCSSWEKAVLMVGASSNEENDDYALFKLAWYR